jgi:hypothetical protein
VPQGNTEAPIGGPNAARVQSGEPGSGGSARTGATGQTMADCMAAWDDKTHIDKNRWRQICGQTLQSPHI